MNAELAFSRVKKTFEDWSMYEAVVRHDYMFHQELVSKLKAIAAQVAAVNANGLNIIDLGCGDAWVASHAFSELSIDSYSGVDLSESAVERARKHLANWGSRATVVSGNLAEFIAARPNQSANLVLASNSVHHFQSEGKAEIIRNCFNTLKPGGVLCWVDPVRNEGESRSQYLHRLTTEMQNDWVALTLDQRQQGIAHVLESDFPETEHWMLSCAAEIGFQLKDRFLNTELFGAWEFVKPSR